MSYRDEFEAIIAQKQALSTGHPVTAADIAGFRQGEGYSAARPDVQYAWSLFLAGRNSKREEVPHVRDN